MVLRLFPHRVAFGEAHSPSAGTAVFSLSAVMSELGRQLGRGGPVKNFDTNHMASLISTVEIGGAGSRHRQTAGSVSGLADSRVRKAGTGHRGKSSEHPEKFSVATWNVGTLKKRQCEVVETLTRRRVDLCSVSEHR